MNADWPELEFARWAPTKRSLHLYAQMLGKLRLALAPHQPNFLFTSLTLTPRGFTTGTMPNGLRSVSASVDLFDRALRLETSDGRARQIELAGARSVAQVFADLHAALAALGIDVTLSPTPQEVADLTPLDRDERPAIFEAHDAQRWLTIMSAVNGVFDRWRSHFFGRTGVQLWWGALDFALLLFSGKHVDPPANRGYLLRYDLDAEMLNAGFYPGDAGSEAYFYGYIYPQPAACSTLPVGAQHASWSDALGEWTLPYAALRSADDPERELVAFLDSIYGLCGSAAGWDRSAFTYSRPPLRRARDAR